MNDDPKAIERRILEMALADLRRAENNLKAMDAAIECIITGKPFETIGAKALKANGKDRVKPLTHDPLEPHEIVPILQPDGTVYCATCDAKLSPEECEAINGMRLTRYIDDVQ